MEFQGKGTEILILPLPENGPVRHRQTVQRRRGHWAETELPGSSAPAVLLSRTDESLETHPPCLQRSLHVWRGES